MVVDNTGIKGNESYALLVTLWDNANFGNRLQAIALKKMLEDCGCVVECLMSSRLSIARRGKRLITEILGAIGVKKYKMAFLTRHRRISVKRSSSPFFDSIAGEAYGYRAPHIDYEKYDVVVTGSDQVWHRWTNWPDELPFFYLEFVEQSKRIAYGASFGREELPVGDIAAHVAGLKGIPSVSCRERIGCEIVKQVSGNDATLVLDPTLCAGRTYWESLEVRPGWVRGDCYKLLFCLGSSDMAYYEAIESSREEDISIINLRSVDSPEVWDIGIAEFIWLIHHAVHVYTDSYHCIVFSILFGTPFTAFRRDQKGYECMWDRIATLLEFTGLQCFEYGAQGNSMHVDRMMRNANEMISIEAERSRAWLASAIDKARRSQR